ncbi:hypothetical protein ACHAQH_005454 [Verticillium albo-atrum]
MDAAAKKVQVLAHSALPDRPYHLARTIDKRYRVPPENLRLREEEEVRPLQYMTLLSDVDRGLLLTRPYYDMREEPSNPHAAKEAVAKVDRKVTKLSLSDYKNKQKRPSPSPPDSALLSPTLPPALEEELARFKETPTASKTARLPDPVGSGKPNRPPRRGDDDEEDQIRVSTKDKERHRDRIGQERFMVTLKCGRRNSKTLKRILALPPSKKERPRSASLDAAPASARKRPASSVEDIKDSIAVKRPRTSEMTSSSKLVAPSTPAKAGTAMSRGASNNSQAHTPGDINSVTPGDRPPTRQEPREPVNPATIRKLRDRYERYKDLGGRLKHKRDAMKSNRDRASSESEQKLSIALCLESAMAYMVSFRAVFDSRRLENKAQDPNTWDTILPLLGTLQRDVGDGRHRALDALQLQLKGVILEELIKCYWSLDPASSAVRLMHFERMRASIWKSAYDAVERVDDHHMRCNLGPWTSAEEAIALGLRTVRRWAADEGVDWRPELSPQTNGL